MKKFLQTVALSAATLAFLAPNVAEAQEVEVSPAPIATEITEAPELEVPIFYAAGWQNLGSWKMKSVIAIGSDGGNLKACVEGTDKVTFNLARDIGVPLPGTLATTSGSGDNCANWSGLSKGAYNLHKDDFRTVYHNVTVYD